MADRVFVQRARFLVELRRGKGRKKKKKKVWITGITLSLFLSFARWLKLRRPAASLRTHFAFRSVLLSRCSAH